MSVQRWHAYIEDDDGDDLFVSHQQDAQGQWVRYDDHAAEVQRLRDALERLESDNESSEGLLDMQSEIIEEQRVEVERLQARERELETALREIRDQEWTENVLDPQWAARIATATLAAVSAETEDDDE